eukprot:jgi/Chrzof1/2701/Cz11g25210.t1
MDQASCVVLAVSLAIILICPGVLGHGFITKPAARNWLAYLNEKYDWPDGLNGGGHKVVGASARWPNGKHSLCGDAANDPQQRFMKPGKVTATYKSGSIITIDVLVSTNHYGRFEFRLCPPGATNDKQCTKLQRADNKGLSWDLPMVAQGSRFHGGAVGMDNLRPARVDTSYTWYKQPHTDCAWWKHCDRYDNHPVYSLKYKLPKGYSCNRCILQWYYLTGHKCIPPCQRSDRYYPNCRNDPKYAGTYLKDTDYCGNPWAAYPEEFWNCADISIEK